MENPYVIQPAFPFEQALPFIQTIARARTAFGCRPTRWIQYRLTADNEVVVQTIFSLPDEIKGSYSVNVELDHVLFPPELPTDDNLVMRYTEPSLEHFASTLTPPSDVDITNSTTLTNSDVDITISDVDTSIIDAATTVSRHF